MTRGQAAMFALLQRVSKPVRLQAARLVGDERADDAVQQAFLKVVDVCFRDGDEPPVEPLDALFNRVLRNHCLDVLKESARHLRAPDGQVNSGAVDAPVFVDHGTPALVAEGSILAARVHEFIETLPAQMRRVMQSAELLDWDASAVSKETGIKYTRVKWHLKEGKERLRRELERDGYAVRPRLRIGRPAGTTRTGRI